MIGYITELNLDKGFGFIRGSDGVSRFAHASEFVPRTWFDKAKIKDNVIFESAQGKQDKGSGLRAVNIRKQESNG